MSAKKKIAVIDTETDPFKYGRVPRPFCAEFYAEHEFKQFWGDDCIVQLVRFIEKLPDEYMIYAHNGGKFDFHFFHDYLENPIRVIKSRIVSAEIFQHQFRDSFSILPVPLRAYAKDDFDYNKMERNRRERHKVEILKYLHSDCVYLYELVSRFVDMFGLKLTIGSAAMAELNKRYDFVRFNRKQDECYRRFYFGGRVQCFKGGILKGPWKYVDVNSMYPDRMKNAKHPVNGAFIKTTDLKLARTLGRTYFCRFIGKNKGAMPCVAKDGSLSFTKTEGEFFACSHEMEMAFSLGLLEVDRVLECYIATQEITFGEYVDDMIGGKIAAELAGDKALRLFYKLLANNGYGKFGQNPDNFKDYLIVRDPGMECILEDQGYALETDFETFELWSRPAESGDTAFYDVSIAASITSAARAVLMKALSEATDPIYCDTDSIICRDFKGEVHATKLGAWKIEAEAQYAAIAGKKLYALYDDPKGEPVKLATKGGQLELGDILKVCKGEKFKHFSQAPTFSTSRTACKSACERPDDCRCFVERTFKMTFDDLDTESPWD